MRTQITGLISALIVLVGAQVAAEAPETSRGPAPNPAVETRGPEFLAGTPENSATVVKTVWSLRPAPRPLGSDVLRPSARPTFQFSQASSQSSVVQAVFRPEPRPSGLQRVAIRSGVEATSVAVRPGSKLGYLCGDRDIIGVNLTRIYGSRPGCGIVAPIRVHTVSGVALSRPAIMNCQTAQSLKTWIEQSVRPTIGNLGGGVARIDVAAHYACRTRNHRPGAKISEHGKGNAIDISALTLANGQQLDVLRDWRDPERGKLLRSMHVGACGPFDTVLGPNSDRYHRDHFHFDVRGGRTICR
ncbi:MAG: extensin family protein [Pseudomonadota bacterium]